MAKDKVAATELYALRKAALEAEVLGFKAQLRQAEARLLLLEIERRYGILGSEAKLDINTGQIMAGQDGQEEAGG